MDASFLTLAMAMLVTGADPDVQTNPAGCWLSEAPGASHLLLEPDRTYRFRGEEGRWAAKGDEIWLLGSAQAGTKWRFAIDKDRLTLERPETFKYLGKGNYVYMQFMDPKTSHAFKRASSMDPCRPPPPPPAGESDGGPAKKD